MDEPRLWPPPLFHCAFWMLASHSPSALPPTCRLGSWEKDLEWSTHHSVGHSSVKHGSRPRFKTLIWTWRLQRPAIHGSRLGGVQKPSGVDPWCCWPLKHSVGVLQNRFQHVLSGAQEQSPQNHGNEGSLNRGCDKSYLDIFRLCTMLCTLQCSIK